MTPHDKELMLYNAVILRLEQATEQMYQLISWDEGMMVNKEMRDSIVLAGVYLKDAEYKFKRYAGMKYDSDS